MGIVANDGDHASLFGDYRYGSISDGVLFGTKPLGKDGPLTVAIGAQYVFKDPLVDLSRGDRATQGVLAAYLESGPNQIGVYGAYRHQWNNQSFDQALFTYADTIDVGVIDVAGKFAARVPGSDAWAYGAAEAAMILGSTDELRTPDQALSGQKTAIRSYGGAAQLGVAHVARDAPPSVANPIPGAKPAETPVDWGDVVGQIEVGYASGDANPYGDTAPKRFTFDPNHKVGLLLFDEVMRFQTARAASAAQDPHLSNAARPTPGVNLIPSQGGCSAPSTSTRRRSSARGRGSTRKGASLIAQATADVIDPYRTALGGSRRTTSEWNPAKHDLGVELDGGFEVRIPLDYGVKFALGAQAGVLIPGGGSGGRERESDAGAVDRRGADGAVVLERTSLPEDWTGRRAGRAQ